jgi:hypothetical protein
MKDRRAPSVASSQFPRFFSHRAIACDSSLPTFISFIFLFLKSLPCSDLKFSFINMHSDPASARSQAMEALNGTLGAYFIGVVLCILYGFQPDMVNVSS